MIALCSFVLSLIIAFRDTRDQNCAAAGVRGTTVPDLGVLRSYTHDTTLGATVHPSANDRIGSDRRPCSAVQSGRTLMNCFHLHRLSALVLIHFLLCIM